MNTNQYETVIILTPVLSEQQMKDAVAGYRELITGNGGKLVHEENWGLTKLAYPIQKKARDFITCLNLLLIQNSLSLSNWLSVVTNAFCVTSQ